MREPIAFIPHGIPLQRPNKRARVSTRRPRLPVACDKSSPRLPSGRGFSKPAKNQKVAFVGAETLGISFVCNSNDCNTRITKQIKRRSYEKGTVLIQCPTCQKHHIIADNMGMYQSITGGRKNVEQLAEDAGQKVTRVDPTTFGLEKLICKHGNVFPPSAI